MCLSLYGCSHEAELQSESAKDSHRFLRSDKSIAKASGRNIQVKPEALSNVALEKAAVKSICCEVSTTAEVQADSNYVTHINSTAPGKISHVHVNLGDKVKEGSVLFTVVSAEIEATQAELLQQDAQIRADLQKDLLQIDSDIAVTKTQLSLWENSFKRYKQLLEERIASKADYDSALAQFQKGSQDLEALNRKRQSSIKISTDRLELTLGPLKQKLQLMGMSPDQLNRLLKTRTIDPNIYIKSPEAGIVCERKANIGEIIDTSTCVMTIADFKRVWLTAQVPERDISKLALGDKITLTVDSVPNRAFAGKLDYIADSINADTRTLDVRSEIENPGLILKPKMFGQMRILVGSKQTLTVPKLALQETDGNKVLYVQVRPGVFQERTVALGSTSEQDVEIKSGLTVGETYAKSGTFWLRSIASQQEE